MNLRPSEAFAIGDYCAKRGSLKKNKVQSENYQNIPRISTHGLTVIRRMVQADSCDATPEDIRNNFIIEHYNSVSDNDKQSSYHAFASLMASFKQLKAKTPHIESISLMTDKSGDYTGPYIFFGLHGTGTGQRGDYLRAQSRRTACVIPSLAKARTKQI